MPVSKALRFLFPVFLFKLYPACLFAYEADTQAWRYAMVLSPLTWHRNDDPEHAQVWLAGLERQSADRALQGLSVFSNSFGQPSFFLYPWGKVHRPMRRENSLYVKWAAGLLYGYRGRFEDKVPFNQNGFSPGLILGLGWDFKPGYQAQLNLLGTSAVMFTLNVRFSPGRSASQPRGR